ncbi:hypothetical protein C8R44DRAFT_885003 [Mycena epipterygia]|nr:hypothetical protein C8R44DRAFT_885003 [Mycena epipterygia]
MHRTLRIPELVEMICDHLLEFYPNTSTVFPSLNAFARTSKFFLDPALDCIWKKQYTLLNFVNCMPSDLWLKTRDGEGLRLRRPIAPADWARPLMYASRIKHFVLTKEAEGEMLSRHIFEILAHCIPCEHLFPNLETIVWFPKDESIFPYIHLFLGPKLDGISLYLGDSISALSLLPTLSQKYPRLRVASIKSTLSDDDELQLRSITLFVAGLTRMHTLDLDVIDQPAFEHLGQLTTLRSLKIGLLHRPERIVDALRLPFPALRILNFRHTPVDVASTYINMLVDCNLAMMTLDIPSRTTARRITELYTGLVENCTHTGLSLLTVQNSQFFTWSTPEDDEISHYLIPPASVRSLCCFNNLVLLCLQSPVGFDLDDATAWEMARAWPKMRMLRLEADRHSAHHPSHMTLNGVRAFAQHCLDLAYLSLTFTAIDVPPAEGASDGPRPRQTCLIALRVGTSPISSPPQVAGFLSGIFPALENILVKDETDADNEEGDDEEDEDDGGWNEVQELLPVMQALREEERCWGKSE